MRLLQRGNTKLGPIIHTWTLPAFKTCPGRTAACAAVCYGQRGFYTMPSVNDGVEQNYRASKRANFARKVIQQIRKEKIRLVRWHPAGDFYDEEYIQKWIRIVSRCGATQFYGYTRAWRVPRLLPRLLELNARTNTILWWSTDCETDLYNGAPPAVPGIRVAYMQMHHDEPIPEYANLVFRVKRDTVRKYIDGCLVCPVENGYTGWVYKMTCADCKICFRDRPVPQKPRSYTGPLEKVLV